MDSKIGLACLALPLLATCLTAAETRRTITVTGTGSATAPPDMAVFNAAVVTEAATTRDALTSNSAAVKQILQTLKENQIADKDVQTSGLSINPKYTRPRNGAAELVGYQVTNQVHVIVRNLPSLGTILDAAVQAGSNQIHGIRFDIDNKTGVLDQARNGAVRDARRRAELYAQAAGVHLGQVLTIQESGAVVPVGREMRFATMAADASVPIATGEQVLQASVTIVFELVD